MVTQLAEHRQVGNAAFSGVSAFARNISALLERTEYRRCETGEDIEDIYRLRYKAYRSNDMVPANVSRTIYDSLDDVPNCYRFGVYIDQQLVSTIRVHRINQEFPASASSKGFGDIVHPMIAAGEAFVDPSRFAADPEWSREFPQIPYLTLRIAGMACIHFDATYCLQTVREDHAGFYKRIYQSEQISDARPYPGVYNRVVLYRANVEAIKEQSFARYPFFKSTAMERRLLFDRPMSGMQAPLTVLPTVKYLRNAA